MEDCALVMEAGMLVQASGLCGTYPGYCLFCVKKRLWSMGKNWILSENERKKESVVDVFKKLLLFLIWSDH